MWRRILLKTIKDLSPLFYAIGFIGVASLFICLSAAIFPYLGFLPTLVVMFAVTIVWLIVALIIINYKEEKRKMYDVVS